MSKSRKQASQLPASFGRYGDDPRQLLASAKTKLSSDPRMAAEETYLGMHTALENAMGTTFRTDSAQRAAVAKLAKRNKKLAKKFNELKTALHGKCFYQGECDAGSAGVEIGRAQAWIEELPKKL